MTSKFPSCSSWPPFSKGFKTCILPRRTRCVLSSCVQYNAESRVFTRALRFAPLRAATTSPTSSAPRQLSSVFSAAAAWSCDGHMTVAQIALDSGIMSAASIAAANKRALRARARSSQTRPTRAPRRRPRPRHEELCARVHANGGGGRERAEQPRPRRRGVGGLTTAPSFRRSQSSPSSRPRTRTRARRFRRSRAGPTISARRSPPLQAGTLSISLYGSSALPPRAASLNC